MALPTKPPPIIDETDLFNSQAGQMGSEFIADTAAHTPPPGSYYLELRIIEATVFTTLTDNAGPTGARVGNALGTHVFSPGTVLNGRFSSITLASGSLMAMFFP